MPFLAKFLAALPLSWFADYGLRHGLSVAAVRKINTTISMWGPALGFLIIIVFNVTGKTLILTIIIAGTALNGGITSGAMLNAQDLSPNFCGSVYAIVSTCGKMIAMSGPIICSLVVSNPVRFI